MVDADRKYRGRCLSLMERVDLIERFLPKKRIDPLTNKPLPYNSQRFQQVEELIGICRKLNSRSPVLSQAPADNALKQELVAMTRNHARLKTSNIALRAEIGKLT